MGVVQFGGLQGSVDGGAGHPEGAYEFGDGLPVVAERADLPGLIGIQLRGASGVPPAQTRGFASCGCSFVHEFAFVLGEGGEDPGEHPPGGCGVVDALPQGAQQHPGGGEGLDGADDRGQGAGEVLTRAYPMTAMLLSVAEVGVLTTSNTPSFGPSSATI